MKSFGVVPRTKNKVVCGSPYVPVEWIRAHGLEPRRLDHQGNESRKPIDGEVGICPYMRTFVNSAVSDPDVLAVILPTTCDQMRRGADLATLRAETPVFLMNIPTVCKTESAHKLYLSELKRLGRFLVSLGGTEPDHEKLLLVMQDFNQRRQDLISGEMVLTGKEFDRIIDDSYRSDKEDEDELPYLDCEDKAPVALIGAHLLPRDFELFDMITDAGGVVALNGTDSGERVVPGFFNGRKLQDDPTQAFSSAYLDTIPDIFQRPNDQLFQWLQRMVESREICGVILVRYTWCDHWHAEASRLRECCAVPFLDLELNGEAVGESAKGRLQAFMEMLR